MGHFLKQKLAKKGITTLKFGMTVTFMKNFEETAEKHHLASKGGCF